HVYVIVIPRLRYTSLFLLLIRPPPPSTLFPYTTLFRSSATARHAGAGGHVRPGQAARQRVSGHAQVTTIGPAAQGPAGAQAIERSEEHTSELQSLRHLVCRLLLEKKKKRENEYKTRMQY